MKLQKILLCFLIAITALQVCLGQDIDESQPTENWLKEYNIYSDRFLFHRYDRYSKEDIVKFREKLDLMKEAKSNDEWEGIYSSDFEDSVGFSQLRLDSDIGFVSFYVYTCLPELRHINYGKITNSIDSIQLLPEYAENSPRKSIVVKYIKIKWNDKFYLVEESSLSAFAEKAVGIYVEPNESSNEYNNKWSNYWVNGDFEKPFVGLPEFPANYKKFQRSPIETTIVSVGKRVIESEKELANTFYNAETSFYTITISAGKNKGVKAGMRFNILETEDEVLIITVNQNTSVGIIARAIDEDKKDYCLDKDSNNIPCPKIKASHKVKTQIGRFWW